MASPHPTQHPETSHFHLVLIQVPVLYLLSSQLSPVTSEGPFLGVSARLVSPPSLGLAILLPWH